MISLDDIDRQLIDALQRDGRASYADLAELVGLSPAATRLRVQRLLDAGVVQVVGVTDHHIIESIYFFDPNGHRLELVADTATPEMQRKLDAVKWDMLNEWDKTKKAPKHAAWMHDGSGVPL